VGAQKKPRLEHNILSFRFVHEIGIAQDILAQVLNGAEKQNARSIHRIKLRIGDLSGVAEDALRFALEVGVRDTIAQDAIICMEQIKALCYCSTCEETFEPEDIIFLCPHCGTLSSKILRGRELEVSELEIT
jgi:hydrogenase nickel incorporation protein HypA/HybF